MCPKSGRIWSKIFSPLVWICNGATHFWLLDRVSSSVGWYLPFYIWFPPIIEEIWRPGYPKNTLLKRDIHPVLWSVMISHHIFCSAWNLNILLGKSKTSLKIIDRNVKNRVRIATRGQILAEFESLRQKWQKVILLVFGVKIHIEINVEKRDILLNFKQCDFGQKNVWSDNQGKLLFNSLHLWFKKKTVAWFVFSLLNFFSTLQFFSTLHFFVRWTFQSNSITHFLPTLNEL